MTIPSTTTVNNIIEDLNKNIISLESQLSSISLQQFNTLQINTINNDVKNNKNTLNVSMSAFNNDNNVFVLQNINDNFQVNDA